VAVLPQNEGLQSETLVTLFFGCTDLGLSQNKIRG